MCLYLKDTYTVDYPFSVLHVSHLFFHFLLFALALWGSFLFAYHISAFFFKQCQFYSLLLAVGILILLHFWFPFFSLLFFSTSCS